MAVTEDEEPASSVSDLLASELGWAEVGLVEVLGVEVDQRSPLSDVVWIDLKHDDVVDDAHSDVVERGSGSSEPSDIGEDVFFVEMDVGLGFVDSVEGGGALVVVGGVGDDEVVAEVEDLVPHDVSLLDWNGLEHVTGDGLSWSRLGAEGEDKTFASAWGDHFDDAGLSVEEEVSSWVGDFVPGDVDLLGVESAVDGEHISVVTYCGDLEIVSTDDAGVVDWEEGEVVLKERNIIDLVPGEFVGEIFE